MVDPILLYIPNLIGYFRMMLIIAFYIFHQYSQRDIVNEHYAITGFGCIVVSMFLDMLDGYVARKCNQTSKFGEWLDVFVDIFTRSLCYLLAAIKMPSYALVLNCLIVMEWTTFVATHAMFFGSSVHWKAPPIPAPAIVTKIMANNFKNPIGAFTITGLDGLPLYLYVESYVTIVAPHRTVMYTIGTLLLTGRILALIAESHYVRLHLVAMLHNNKEQ